VLALMSAPSRVITPGWPCPSLRDSFRSPACRCSDSTSSVTIRCDSGPYGSLLTTATCGWSASFGATRKHSRAPLQAAVNRPFRRLSVFRDNAVRKRTDHRHRQCRKPNRYRTPVGRPTR